MKQKTIKQVAREVLEHSFSGQMRKGFGFTITISDTHGVDCVIFSPDNKVADYVKMHRGYTDAQLQKAKEEMFEILTKYFR